MEYRFLSETGFLNLSRVRSTSEKYFFLNHVSWVKKNPNSTSKTENFLFIIFSMVLRIVDIACIHMMWRYNRLLFSQCENIWIFSRCENNSLWKILLLFIGLNPVFHGLKMHFYSATLYIILQFPFEIWLMYCLHNLNWIRFCLPFSFEGLLKLKTQWLKFYVSDVSFAPDCIN